MKSDQLASLLYTAFTETEPQPLAATPEWEHLVPETRDRWVRMATVLCGLMQQKVGGAVGQSQGQPSAQGNTRTERFQLAKGG